MCISRAIPKCCLREIPELLYFNDDLRRSSTGIFEQSFKSGDDIPGGERVAPLDRSCRLECMFISGHLQLKVLFY